MNSAESKLSAAQVQFMQHSFPNIEGWCSPQLVEFLNLIDTVQRAHDARGGVAEIGVHHGKFFLMLEQFVDKDYTSYAIDIFDDQHLNIDGSGCGSLEIFKRNIEKYRSQNGGKIEIIQADSTSTNLDALISSPVRIFSVDGGHTPEHTINDMRLAEKVLHPMGVVILDDILNPHWLGVIEGVTHYLAHYPTLVPFAIGHNKLFLSKMSWRHVFSDAFKSSSWTVKFPVKFFGHELVAM